MLQHRISFQYPAPRGCALPVPGRRDQLVRRWIAIQEHLEWEWIRLIVGRPARSAQRVIYAHGAARMEFAALITHVAYSNSYQGPSMCSSDMKYRCPAGLPAGE
ncbi:hypothetical protein M2280_006111 [Prescottella agglutinans]|uniref:Uncharacterized protein n=1 Tax=Prescottella agglutinans TaxID=1644129 RepID=A0ABT6MKK0_9NOCA|nr:hypothetical protein [Prescottella agglutinans]